MVDFEKVRLNMKISVLEKAIEEKNKRVDRLSGEKVTLNRIVGGGSDK